MSIKETNPKDAIGVTKLPLHLLSPVAKAYWAHAQFVGLAKYQAWNWRASEVKLSVYISAAARHLEAFNGGESYDPVDATHHLGNLMACAAIMLDAIAAGTAVDDRPPKIDFRESWSYVESQMPLTRERYKHIPQNPHTILNTFVPPVGAPK